MIKRSLVILLLIAMGSIFLSLLLGFAPDSDLNFTGRYYAEYATPETGATNIVTAIIVTYRGLDTLGEVTVLFLTAAIVGLVLARDKRKSTHKLSPVQQSGELLLTGKSLLVPLIVLLGIYVFVNGHLTPGGGFQGGAILASAVLMLLLINPRHPFSHRFITVIESLSGVMFVAIGIAGMVYAGGFLDNHLLPLGNLGELFSAGVIPVIYSLIGLKVGAEFSSMLLNFSETQQ